jgi:hypothetical protein
VSSLNRAAKPREAGNLQKVEAQNHSFRILQKISEITELSRAEETLSGRRRKHTRFRFFR